jgi:hypothetical protein
MPLVIVVVIGYMIYQAYLDFIGKKPSIETATKPVKRGEKKPKSQSQEWQGSAVDSFINRVEGVYSDETWDKPKEKEKRKKNRR